MAIVEAQAESARTNRNENRMGGILMGGVSGRFSEPSSIKRTTAQGEQFWQGNISAAWRIEWMPG
jgi:hypothetical protein